MSNFWRTVKLALRHRLTLLGILGFSFAVAVLWGGNIGTIYPFVEVVFDGQSMHQWLDDQTHRAEQESDRWRRTIETLDERLAQGGFDESSTLHREREQAAVRWNREQNTLRRLAWVGPWIRRYAPHTAFGTLLLIVAVLMTGTVLKDLCLLVQMLLVERLAQVTTYELRGKFFRRSLRMDMAAFGADRSSGLMSRFTHDLAHVTGGIHTLFGKFLLEPLKMLACLIGAAWICWRLLLVSLILAPLAGFIIRQLARSLKRASRRAMEQMARLYGVLSEAFMGIEVVKAYTMERYERQRFHQISKQYLQKSMRIAMYNALLRPATEIMGLGVICVGIIVGGYLVMFQETGIGFLQLTGRPLDRGAIMTFFALMIGVSDPARKLADVFSLVQRASAAADRVYAQLDREPAVRDPDHPLPAPVGHREIVLDHVDFHYVPGQPVLHNVNLRLECGETVAVVGPNGCGKSTLVSLLLRFYDPTRGSVRLDDIDLRDLRLRDLRRKIGLVTQKTLLFDDSILNNIRYGAMDASEDEVVAAAQQAHAHQFIVTRLEHGYQTIVGEQGSKLSGGQRQRVALARAILRNPEILVLDEATSQIDLESEQLIHQTLREFVRGRTTILITHRLATLDLAHRIVVIDAGRIVGIGDHRQLLETCELYRRLSQAGLRDTA